MLNGKNNSFRITGGLLLKTTFLVRSIYKAGANVKVIPLPE